MRTPGGISDWSDQERRQESARNSVSSVVVIAVVGICDRRPEGEVTGLAVKRARLETWHRQTGGSVGREEYIDVSRECDHLYCQVIS